VTLVSTWNFLVKRIEADVKLLGCLVAVLKKVGWECIEVEQDLVSSILTILEAISYQSGTEKSYLIACTRNLAEDALLFRETGSTVLLSLEWTSSVSLVPLGDA
jgi:hypothetical protein